MTSEVFAGSLPAALARWINEQTHQGLLVTDTALRVVFWNRWMHLRTGRAAADLLGRPLFDIYPDAAVRGLKECYELALDGHVTVLSHGLHRFVLAMPPTNADLGLAEMPQSGLVGPLWDESTVIGTVTVIDDVSERLANESELRKQIAAQRSARALAESSLRAKEEFLSTLSHEIRTPLNAVLGWARILLTRQDLDRELLERGLTIIERNANAQARLIDDLLDMARIVAGKLRLEVQPVDLLGIVLAAVDVVMPSATAKRIRIRTSLDPKTPRVMGDPDRLQQSVWNLLSNALKFTEAGGTIEVKLEVGETSARIIIGDTGQGISAEFLPLVFDRFRQNDASSARRHGGLGLGLALVREIVELHGGTVSASSEGEGHGSTFTIELPTEMSPQPRGAHANVTRLESAPSLAGVRVLVVEDESDARELVVTALEQRGAEVLPFSCSADAVDGVSQSVDGTLPHVVVSDIGMPGEDGYELIRRIRSLPPERGGRIPAIAVTGYAARDDVARALAAGYQLHVSKPIDPRSLVVVVAKLAGVS